MRLDAGGIRELHWHQQAEWAVMTYGNCRVTVLDAQGRPYVADVKAGDLWYFPPGLPHSLQGLGPDGAEFVLAFDNGAPANITRCWSTDWFAHTPPEVLAKNFGVPADAFKNIPLQQRWIFQGEVPGPLAADQAAMASAAGAPPYPFVFRLSDMKPDKSNAQRYDPGCRHQQLPCIADGLRRHDDDQAGRACAKCTGTRMPTSGSTTSRARRG